MAVVLLRPVAALSKILGAPVVHPFYFPYPVATSVHAARISIVYQHNVRLSGNQGKLNWPTYLAGFLVMCWGGPVLAHWLLMLPPPPLYSVYPWINYLSIHLALTAFFHAFPSLLIPKYFDTLLFLPDAILRIGAVIGSLNLIASHPNPNISQSIFLQLIIGAVASAGGGVCAATLGTWNPDWKFSTPIFLRGGLLGTLDVWAGALMAAIFGLLTASHPTYQWLLFKYNATDVPGPLLTPLGAKSAGAIILAGLYAWRVAMVHYVGRPTPPKSKME